MPRPTVKNPKSATVKPKKKSKYKGRQPGKPGYLTRNDTERFFAHVKRKCDEKYWFYMRCQYNGAARVSDALALKPRDIRKTCFLIGDKKTSKGDSGDGKRRTISSDPAFLKELHEYIDRLGIGPDERIFPFTDSAVSNVFVAARKTFKCEDDLSCMPSEISSHSLRGSAISYMCITVFCVLLSD